MIRCLIVDDDKLTRTSLEHLCKKEQGIEVVGACENVSAALTILESEPVELILLDIEMPEQTGFDLLAQLPIIPYVIIISSKEEYAYEAFQYEVNDYLKKPVTPARFKAAVSKVKSDESPADAPEPESIFIKADGKFIQLNLGDIDFIENVGDYVRFHTERGNYIVYSTMKNLDKRLPSSRFMKVHRSYIVNLRKIIDIEENTLLIKKHVIPISRANKSPLIARLNMI